MIKIIDMKIDKTEFYQTGFYSLIAMVIGFIIGSIINIKGQPIEHITIPVTIGDSIKVNTTIEKKSNKVSARYDTTKPTDKAVLSELERQHVSHPHIVLAQAKLESNMGKSDVFKRTNNLFGLRKGNDYHHFSHWKQSITYYKNHVQSRYRGGDYYDFLADIGYAEDKEYINKLKDIV